MATTTKARATKTEPKSRKREDGNDPEQYKRFREFAREVEAEDDPKAFDRAARKILNGCPS